MSRSTLDRLRDVIDSANLAIEHLGGRNAAVLANAALPRDATLFRLAIACEAASQLPDDVKAFASDIPWRKVKDTRNHVVHGYWQVDYDIVVDTITGDLEPLKAAAQRLMRTLEDNIQ